jgi:hypothetical protein
LSSHALNKEGYVQKEIKFALDCADEKPPDTIFLIPVKLEECRVPDRLSHLHCVDLTGQAGYDKLLGALRKRADAPEHNAADLPKQLPSNAFQSAQASRAEAALRIFAPELARILARQIHILDRSIANFICASVESTQRPNDHWTTFKPSKPSLYPSAAEFRDLSSQDCSLLVEFYDSIIQIEDAVNQLHESEIEWDVNSWNVLMQGTHHSVGLGVRAAERFCPSREYSPIAPASGSLVERARKSGERMRRALAAHLDRYNKRATSNQNLATQTENTVALRMAQPNLASRSGSENQTDQLQFTFGHETKVANGLYKTAHTFSVGVKNASQSHFLSNCKVYIDIADESGVTPKSYLIVDTFTLNATEERLVPIVRFDEPATISAHKGSTIQLLIPVVGGYYNVGWGWPWRLPIGAYAFTLRATAKEVGAIQVVCKVSVDDAGRLHFRAA